MTHQTPISDWAAYLMCAFLLIKMIVIAVAVVTTFKLPEDAIKSGYRSEMEGRGGKDGSVVRGPKNASRSTKIE